MTPARVTADSSQLAAFATDFAGPFSPSLDSRSCCQYLIQLALGWLPALLSITRWHLAVLALRLDGPSHNTKQLGTLKSVSEKSGFLGELKTKTFQALGDAQVPNYPKAWLPTERAARAWHVVVTGTPFDPGER